MNKPGPIYCTYFSIVLLVFGAIAQAQAQAQANEGHSEKCIRVAEDRFEAEVAASQKKLKTDINRAMEVAMDRAANDGDLNALELLKAESDTYNADGVLPTHESVKALVHAHERRIERAGDGLVIAYKRMLREYTQAREIEKARVIQKKMLWIRPTAELDLKQDDGHHYLLVVDKNDITWDTAKAACERLGGYLVCLNSKSEAKFILKLMKKEEVVIWVGADDREREGHWQWIDGSEDDYWPWAHRQPDNLKRSQDVAWFALSGEMLDIDAGATGMSYVCEWEMLPTRGTLYQEHD